MCLCSNASCLHFPSGSYTGRNEGVKKNRSLRCFLVLKTGTSNNKNWIALLKLQHNGIGKLLWLETPHPHTLPHPGVKWRRKISFKQWVKQPGKQDVELSLWKGNSPAYCGVFRAVRSWLGTEYCLSIWSEQSLCGLCPISACSEEKLSSLLLGTWGVVLICLL